ncbi:MAG: hypothetical protein J7M25_14975 [Deltaproteobacteria bacterium]|nr:hypothetical protein [Deltaproteobacteria bacterium]
MVDVRKLVTPPALRPGADMDATEQRSTPGMDDEPACGVKLTQAIVVPTPAMAGEKTVGRADSASSSFRSIG